MKVGVIYGSPEVTTGGMALKFFSSVRLDVRRIETEKAGTEAVGNRTRVKIVKNKCAPPLKIAEFSIDYGTGISRLGEIVDLGVASGLVSKGGAWLTYGDEKWQGRSNAIAGLSERPDLADELEGLIRRG